LKLLLRRFRDLTIVPRIGRAAKIEEEPPNPVRTCSPAYGALGCFIQNQKTRWPEKTIALRGTTETCNLQPSDGNLQDIRKVLSGRANKMPTTFGAP